METGCLNLKRGIYTATHLRRKLKKPHLTHFHDIHLNESTHPIYIQVCFGQPQVLSSIASENNAAAQRGIREGYGEVEVGGFIGVFLTFLTTS